MRSLLWVRAAGTSRPTVAIAAVVIGSAHGKKVELSEGGKRGADYDNVHLHTNWTRICVSGAH